MNFLPFGHPLPWAWAEPPPPSGPLSELPGVDYPRTIIPKAHRYSLVLVRTASGNKWTFVEDSSLSTEGSLLLRLILDTHKDGVGVMDVFPPEVLGLSSHLIYRYIAFEERIATYIRKDSYNQFVVKTLSQRLEETRQIIDAHLAFYFPPFCSQCKSLSLHAH